MNSFLLRVVLKMLSLNVTCPSNLVKLRVVGTLHEIGALKPPEITSKSMNTFST